MTQTSPVSLLGGKVRSLTYILTYAAQAAGSITLDGLILPKGARFLCALFNADTSSGSTTLALGISGSTAKYTAAAALTATDTPTWRAKAAVQGVALTAAEQLLLTTAAATAPASGTLAITVFYVDNS